MNVVRARGLDIVVCVALLFMPFWHGRDRRLHGARHPNRRDGAGGDVAQFPARLHRRPVLRSRRLLRARRLWRGDGDQVSRRRDDPRHRARHAGRDPRRDGHRRPDRQAPRRLFRHGDDRLRPGVLFPRLSLEFGHRRRRRAHRLAPYADRLRRRHAGHLRQRQGVLLLRARGLRRLRRRDGDAARLALRTHADRHSRERAARALSWAPDRVPHLAVFRDLVPVRQRGRRALCAAQQLHRSARAALRPVRQSRHHGGARRHALVLGPADRGGDLRRAAGLRLQPHRKLDVGDRARLRAGGALLSARGPRHAARWSEA